MLSKSHLIKYFLILFALLFNHQIKASSLFVIDSYTVKDGLSHNTIWCALQDSYGFIWLGTNNGLNCFDGQKNTERLVVRNPKLKNLLEDGEYIPSLGQLNLMAHYKDSINDALEYIGAEPLASSSAWYWSSTEYSQNYAWGVNFSSGSALNNSKYSSGRVRAVAAFSFKL